MFPSLFLLATPLLPGALAQLSSTDVATVSSKLAQGATESWEIGTRAEALLELNANQFSVFSSIPPPNSVPSNTTSALSPVFSIASNVVKALKNTSAPAALIPNDGAAGDPASIGVAVLLANWTGQNDGLDYARAAQNQLDYLLYEVPKTSDGAISHRVAQVQLWSDNVYMVPPFLAYYGVLTGNTSLIDEAYNQINLYRNYLRDTSANNLWKHIVLGNDTSDGGNDPGHWSTGNGWAAAGMLRVLATMKNSPYSGHYKSQQKNLASWVKEIHTAMFSVIDHTNIFMNYADQNISSSGSFYDTSSTMLITGSVYRYALLWGDHTHLPNAEKCRQALFATSGSGSSSDGSASSSKTSSSETSASKASSSASSRISGSSFSSSASASSAAASPSASAAGSITNFVHFTDDGWLTPVVNPDQFGVQGSDSAESEAFTLDFQAAYSEWVAAGSQGIDWGSRVGISRIGAASAMILVWTLLYA
ncbi:hypothetical protein HMN09_00078300 [Mycena chlorophos]|uniref:Six-hairpin glycosidase n=1 Tax=Mycena chlorophos TaxID=658473 RepID=A0A8H6TTD7_MYCCL|nr:hypothetical protein HMN09_00078300 [Mycena chlorophos]